MNLGIIMTAIFQAMKRCVESLQGITITFASFTFNLWDFMVGCFVLVLVLRILFPWFDDAGEDM